jgi:hypothetical protein
MCWSFNETKPFGFFLIEHPQIPNGIDHPIPKHISEALIRNDIQPKPTHIERSIFNTQILSKNEMLTHT